MIQNRAYCIDVLLTRSCTLFLVGINEDDGVRVQGDVGCAQISPLNKVIGQAFLRTFPKTRHLQVRTFLVHDLALLRLCGQERWTLRQPHLPAASHPRLAGEEGAPRPLIASQVGGNSQDTRQLASCQYAV